MKAKNILFFSVILYSSTNCNISDPVEKLFTDVYKSNAWISQESTSGVGSELRYTQKMSQKLSALIKLFDITSIADAPCGDLNWMRYVDMGICRYIGIDIVLDLIERNIQLFGPTKEFKHLNLIENVIDKVDLIICRDLFAHLTNDQIFIVLKNFKQSGSKYILMTTSTATEINHDSKTGHWRGINFQKTPFNFPKPILLIQEDTPFAWEHGKHLGLWLLEDLYLPHQLDK